MRRALEALSVSALHMQDAPWAHVSCCVHADLLKSHVLLDERSLVSSRHSDAHARTMTRRT